jgi:hypothetical protein
LEIVPGVIAAHASQTVVILEPLEGSEVRVRDVASGIEKIVPVCELSGAALAGCCANTDKPLRPPAYSSVIAAPRNSIGDCPSRGKPL